jgi:hypothetical protein
VDAHGLYIFQEDLSMRLLRSSARWLLLALLLPLIPASQAHAGVFISVGFAPPVLPVYVQPVCPAPNLMWTPGYWAYGPQGYFWVPGAWVPAPFVGALWTPPFWGWSGGAFLFHPGYWGPHVGFYGGVNYGFGYMGIGFAGGMWRGGVFAYNTGIMRVNTTIIHNTFVDNTIIRNTTVVNNNRVSFNGGPGGINHQMTPEERSFSNETHTPPTSFQTQHEQTARADRTAYAKVNGGRPQNLVASHPLQNESHPAPPSMRAAAGRPSGPANTVPGAHPNPQGARTGPEARPSPAARPEARPAPQQRQAPAQHAAPRPAQRQAPQEHPREPRGR